MNLDYFGPLDWFFMLFGAVVALLVIGFLCVLCYNAGFRQGNRRWLRDRNPYELDFTAKMRRQMAEKHR